MALPKPAVQFSYLLNVPCIFVTIFQCVNCDILGIKMLIILCCQL